MSVAITREDYQWHRELHRAVLNFLYHREGLRRDPSQEDALAEAEAALFEVSWSPTDRRRLQQFMEKLMQDEEL